MSFNNWSQTNPDTKKVLSPDLGIRGWGEIDKNQKQAIWRLFVNKGWFDEDEVMRIAVSCFSEDYKAGMYCQHWLMHGGSHKENEMVINSSIKPCCRDVAHKDFEHIFNTQSQEVFYELLSYYVQSLEKNSIYKENAQKFKNRFNDISNQFGLNVLLGETGFIIKQDEKIVDDIYKPVHSFLSDEKWIPVNRDLGEANTSYLKDKEEEYSRCITLTVSALQAFLQILVNGVTGKGDIGDLIKEGQKKGVIPNDPFSTKVFKDIEAVIMRERQDKSDAHSKKEYANEISSRLLMNLVMVFMQHVIQSQKI